MDIRNWLLCGSGCLLLLCIGSTNYYRIQRDEAETRAETAEKALFVLKTEREKLELALEDQQRATAEAQMNKKIVYKTIQKEVQTDATARDWYSAPIPAGFTRLLKDNASAR